MNENVADTTVGVDREAMQDLVIDWIANHLDAALELVAESWLHERSGPGTRRSEVTRKAFNRDVKKAYDTATSYFDS